MIQWAVVGGHQIGGQIVRMPRISAKMYAQKSDTRELSWMIKYF